MKKVRIVERTSIYGSVTYVIQRRYNLFAWSWWDDASSYDSFISLDPRSKNTFSSLEEAKRNLCYFDGTKVQEKIVFENN